MAQEFIYLLSDDGFMKVDLSDLIDWVAKKTDKTREAARRYLFSERFELIEFNGISLSTNPGAIVSDLEFDGVCSTLETRQAKGSQFFMVSVNYLSTNFPEMLLVKSEITTEKS